MNDIRQRLADVVTAWDSLSRGEHSPAEVNNWLAFEMKPAIDAARSVLSKTDPLTSTDRVSGGERT